MPFANEKRHFIMQLQQLTNTLAASIESPDHQWTMKGFIDVHQNIYTLSSDTKIVSKVLELHLFPQLQHFADHMGYDLVLADHQNYYPDMSFVNRDNSTIKFAVDFKTTFRSTRNPGACNGFTLGSHGTYFKDRTSRKNIQFPYREYAGHLCLGIIYSRCSPEEIDERVTYSIDELPTIVSVIRDLQFFVHEKWRIASDKSGSGNTANIGSVKQISNLLAGRGTFAEYGEQWFDDYWMNYGKILVTDHTNTPRPIKTLHKFLAYRGSSPRVRGEER